MFRSVSDSRGFTLLEGLVAMLASAILIGAVTRFFKDSNRAFTTQKQVSERDQNAHFVIKRLTEILMQAGFNLPEKSYKVITPSVSPSNRLSLAVNPRGGQQVVPATIANKTVVPVGDESGFRKATSLIWVPTDKSLPTMLLEIDRSCSVGGFKDGLKAVPGGMDSIMLKLPIDLSPGDVLYAATWEDYHVEGTDLLVGDLLLAENIESFSIGYFAADGHSTLDWNAMRSAKITVTGRTTVPDYRLPGDGYQRITLSTDLRFRNRF